MFNSMLYCQEGLEFRKNVQEFCPLFFVTITHSIDKLNMEKAKESRTISRQYVSGLDVNILSHICFMGVVGVRSQE